MQLGKPRLRLVLLLTVPLAASPGCTWMYRHPSFPDTTPARADQGPAETIDLRVEANEGTSA